MKEGARDNAFQMFLPLFQKRGIEMNVSQLKQMMLRKLTSEAGMHNLSLRSNYYLLGATRYYFEGKLTTNTRLNALYPNVSDKFIPDICKRLDALVLILRNAYIDTVGTQFEQPEDFGNLSLEKLLRKYNKKINKELGLDKKDEDEVPNANNDYSAGNGYTYDILYSYEDAQKYNEYTEPGAWCITYGKAHYDGYIKRLGIHYVIFRQNGFENVPRRMGNGFTKRKPHDAYGNSLIAVLQSNRSPEPIYITSRWNHGSSQDGTQGTEADHAYTTEEFLNVIGSDYSVLERAYEQWKATVPTKNASNRGAGSKQRIGALRKLKYCQMLINGGKDPRELRNEGISLHPLYYPIRTDDDKLIDEKMNGLYAVTLNVDNDTCYCTIMDRKKLLIDQVFVKGSYFGQYSLTDDAVLIEFSGDKDRFFIYQRKRHRLFDIDGVYEFRQINNAAPSRGNKQYIILALSGNQVALVKLDTMTPIRAKNSSPWFEGIVPIDSWRKTNFANENRGTGINLPSNVPYFVKMIYDSAADENYIYNTLNGSFMDDGSTDEWKFSHASAIRGNLVSFLYRNGETTMEKVFDFNANQFVSIGGFSSFSDMKQSYDSISGRTYLIFSPFGEDEHYRLFDMTSGAYVTFNGSPVILNVYSLWYWSEISGYVVYKTSPSVNTRDVYMVVNPYNNTVVSPSKTNPLVSDYGNPSQYVTSVLLSNDSGEKITVWSAKNEFDVGRKKAQDARDQFQETLKRIGTIFI